jgi:hypothetical protein
MPKYLIYPNPERHPVVKYERRTENLVNGKLEEDYQEDRTMTRAPFTKFSWSIAPSKKLGGHLNTGLLDYVDNPYKDVGSYRTPEWREILEGKDKILKQTELEYKHGHSPDYYSNVIDVRVLERDPKDMMSNFFQTKAAFLNLSDGVTILDTDNNPIHEVLYYGMLKSDVIANSYQQINPDTRFYIAKEQEEEERKAEKSRKRNGAIAKLEEVSKKNDSSVKEFCKVLNQPRSKKITISADVAYGELNKFIDNANDSQLNEFLNVYDMWASPESKRKFKAHVLLSDALDTNVIWNKGNEYTWQPPRNETDSIPQPVTFTRQSEVIDFLSEQKFQEERELITRQIDAKLRV